MTQEPKDMVFKNNHTTV